MVFLHSSGIFPPLYSLLKSLSILYYTISPPSNISFINIASIHDVLSFFFFHSHIKLFLYDLFEVIFLFLLFLTFSLSLSITLSNI